MRFSEFQGSLPAVPMERPFRLFGRTFAVRLSTPLVVEPNTTLWVLSGESLERVVASAGTNVFDVLRRGLVKKQNLSRTTLAPLRRGLRPLLPPDLPEDASLQAIADAMPRASAWSLFLRGFGEHEGEGLCSLGRGLINIEAMFGAAVKLHDEGRTAEAETLFVLHVGTPWEFWVGIGIPDARAYLPLDVLCQQLAAVEASGAAPGVPSGGMLSLLDPAKRPMGHWLRRQQKRAGCRSLQALSDHAKVANYERMRAWSAGRDLLPPAKAEAIVDALGDDQTGAEMARYRWARLASFLSEWVICATPGHAPTWSDSQTLVAQRYRELLDLAVSRQQGKGN